MSVLPHHHAGIRRDDQRGDNYAEICQQLLSVATDFVKPNPITSWRPGEMAAAPSLMVAGT
jgi:hypothetical protein